MHAEYRGSSGAVLRSASYWTPYILLKHLSEVGALGTQLLVSSAIKSYDGSQTFTVRHSPLQGSQAFYSTPSERTPLVSASRGGEEGVGGACATDSSTNYTIV
ncbi:hypothetical protein EON64_10605 [archaeon]|nr:MAG: hypothetical protein EON64_10605 [archaeon]